MCPRSLLVSGPPHLQDATRCTGSNVQKEVVPIPVMLRGLLDRVAVAVVVVVVVHHCHDHPLPLLEEILDHLHCQARNQTRPTMTPKALYHPCGYHL